MAKGPHRRGVIVEAAPALVGNFEFWTKYWAWANGTGPAHLLHYLQRLDLAGFDVRRIPRTAALARQIEQTALRDPAVAWWHTVLSEGQIEFRAGALAQRVTLADDGPTAIAQGDLRASFADGGRRRDGDFAAAMRRLRAWHTIGTTQRRLPSGTRVRELSFPPLPQLREEFAHGAGVRIDPEGSA